MSWMQASLFRKFVRELLGWMVAGIVAGAIVIWLVWR
jgi:hypothetical protein